MKHVKSNINIKGYRLLNHPVNYFLVHVKCINQRKNSYSFLRHFLNFDTLISTLQHIAAQFCTFQFCFQAPLVFLPALVTQKVKVVIVCQEWVENSAIAVYQHFGAAVRFYQSVSQRVTSVIQSHQSQYLGVSVSDKFPNFKCELKQRTL